MESFYATKQTYASALASNDVKKSGLDIGGGAGQVEITAANANSYTIVGHSASGGNFTITKAANGLISRSCDKPGDGACPSNGNW